VEPAARADCGARRGWHADGGLCGAGRLDVHADS
jgi:hypothetical protein